MREIGGLSARRLSDLANVAEASAAQIERGFTQSPRTETIAKLAQVLGASLDWLIAGAGDPPDAEAIAVAIAKAEAAHNLAKGEGGHGAHLPAAAAVVEA